jgi:hypothetical protein
VAAARRYSVEVFDMTGSTVAAVTLPASVLRLPTYRNCFFANSNSFSRSSVSSVFFSNDERTNAVNPSRSRK